MSFTLKMDRPIDSKHYICPGSYNLGGKQFDFCQHYGNIDDADKSVVHFTVQDFDAEYSDDAVTPADTEKSFEDFFIYTGEYDDAEIRPVEVKELLFTFTDGSLKASPELLKSANKCLSAL